MRSLWLVRARSIASFVNGRGAQRACTLSPDSPGKYRGKTYMLLFSEKLHGNSRKVRFYLEMREGSSESDTSL